MSIRINLGMVAAFGAGYYLGARAGRARYEQIRRALDALPFGEALSKGQALFDLGAERLRRTEPENVVPIIATGR